MGKKTKNAKKNKFVVMPTVEGGDDDTSKNEIVTKKVKKNKIVEMSVDNTNNNEPSGTKSKKAKKNKLVKIPVEVATDMTNNNKLAKKRKKTKIIESSVELTAPKAKKAKKEIATEETSEDEKNEAQDISAEENESEPNKVKTKKAKKKKNKENNASNGEVVPITAERKKFLQISQGVTEEMIARYPVLNDEALAAQFMAVSLGTTQKGRMRQIFKASLQGTPEALLPDVIHNRIKIILKTPTLTETALRKLRILYSMLKTALMTTKPEEKKKIVQVTENKSKDGEKSDQKVKGPKRWVVFIGNLAKDITKEKILEHFSDLGENIVDVRIPKKSKEPKSAIAYLEVSDNLHFELALSKHHTMLDNRRINVLYTAQSGSKISKAEAKGKTAKLVALKKSGKLAGSVPLSKKRSARRKKMKEAQKTAEAS